MLYGTPPRLFSFALSSFNWNCNCGNVYTAENMMKNEKEDSAKESAHTEKMVKTANGGASKPRLRNNHTRRAVVTTLLLFTLLGLATLYVWQKKTSMVLDEISINTTGTRSEQTNQTIAEDGPMRNMPTNIKQTVIVEWNLKAPVAESLKDQVKYILKDTVVDPDGNKLVQAKFFIIPTPNDRTTCPTGKEIKGPYIDAATQIIRSEKDKPFNASRYGFNFRENVASDSKYNYHLNSASLDCMGSETVKQAEILRAALTKLQKIN